MSPAFAGEPRRDARGRSALSAAMLVLATACRCAEPGSGSPSPADAGADWVEVLGPSSIRIRGSSHGLEVTALEPGVIRLEYLGTPPRPARSFAVADRPTVADLQVLRSAESVTLKTGELALEVDRTCAVRALDASGSLLFEDGAAGGYFEDGAKVGVRRTIRAEDRYYGFGEKGGRLEKRGGPAMTFWNTDPYDPGWGGYPPGADPLYHSIPFFIGLGSSAYGVFTDNTHRLRMDPGAADPDVFSIAAEGGAIVQYVIAGPRFDDVLRRYTWLTGRMPLPPRWALGFHQSRWGYKPDSQVRDIARALRDKRIPADGLWLDIQHMDGYRSFTWDPQAFPDPAGLMSDLLGMGFKTTLIVDPGIKVDPAWEIYAAGLRDGHFLLGANGRPYVGKVWPGDSVFPDFTAPRTRAWWQSLVGLPVALGARGLWIDMNEPANQREEPEGMTVPNALKVDGDGAATTMAEAHNVYALEEARATWEGMRAAAPSRRPFVLTRAGYAGIQRYAAVWTGDASSTWEALRESVPMLLNLGLSGVPLVGSDVGGFAGKATPELYARWMQLGALSPFFRVHCNIEGNPQEPWALGPEVEAISRAMIQERYELLPYLYSLAREAAETGAPILRPLVYEFQGEAAAQIDDEVMLGPWLLYAPVLEAGANRRSVVLPAGRWFEEHSGAVVDSAGGAVPIEPLTLAARPAYVREGAIIPRAELMQWTDERADPLLRLDLYPSAKKTEFAIYEDDGDGFAHEQGAYSKVVWSLQRHSGGATLTASAPEGSRRASRTVLARVRRVDQPATGVRLDGAPLPAQPSREALLAAGGGYWHDPDDLSLLVAFAERAPMTLELDYGPALSAPEPPVAVRFAVTVPAGTPTTEPICVASSANGWTHQPLQWAGPNLATGELLVRRGDWFFYKFTRGAWDTVEVAGGCAELTNRYGFAAAGAPRAESVAGWADACP